MATCPGLEVTASGTAATASAYLGRSAEGHFSRQPPRLLYGTVGAHQANICSTVCPRPVCASMHSVEEIKPRKREELFVPTSSLQVSHCLIEESHDLRVIGWNIHI